MFAVVVVVLASAAVAGAPDPIDAYLDATAGPGERVVYENHHRRVFAADGACKAECDELDAKVHAWKPRDAPTLVVVDVGAQRARVVAKGKTILDVRVAFGQEPGAKVQQGDNKTPRGRYVVVDKKHGAFGGKWGAYYGGHWIKISYPNAFDARRGLSDGLVSEEQARAIEASDARGEMGAQNTRLGGGIGFHAWIEEWPDPAEGDAPLGLSWGCIVLHPSDVAQFYAHVERGAVVVIR